MTTARQLKQNQLRAMMMQAYQTQAQMQSVLAQTMANAAYGQTSSYPTWVTSNATTTSTGTVNSWVSLPTSGATTVATNAMNALYNSQHLGNSALVRDTLKLLGDVTIADGEPCKITLPDGGSLEVDADGSYRINDANAVVTYRANRLRDFNSFLNASDKLEAFIKYCGTQGVRQDEMLELPIRLFISWLILQAAIADGEAADQITLIKQMRDQTKPRCIVCGRFISPKLVSRKVTLCRSMCLERALAA